MGKVFTLKVKPNDERIFFYTGDWHIPEHNLAAISLLIQHAEMVPIERRVLIMNGDVLDLAFLMKKHALFTTWIYNTHGMDKYFIPEMNSTINIANKLLDALARIFSTIIIGEGNHESARVEEFLKVCPEKYKPEFDIPKRLFLKERGIFYYKYNTYLDIADVCCTHGRYCGKSALERHFKSAQKNVIISHLHSYWCESFETREDTGFAYSACCMCNKPDEENARYMQWADNKWSNGYLTGQIENNKMHITGHVIKDNCLRLPTGQLLIGGSLGK